MTDPRITPVILSGGAGTRLWPLSRAERPKQLLALTESQTMLQMTAARTASDPLFAEPVVVASERHAEEVERQLAEIGVAPSPLILEPLARNTAPAIALAALVAEPQALLLVMPSDHLIGRPDVFLSAVQTAATLATQDWFVTFGIRPDRPETGYGYIRRSEQLAPGVFAAAEFVEKPDAATAERYVDSGSYDWNGGIFLFRANTFLEALGRYEPAMLAACRDAVAAASRDGMRLVPSADAFAGSPSRSIDHAVMEKDDRIAVVPVDMGWSDIGSWDALYELGERDGRGNVADAETLLIDSDGCLIRSDGPLVAAVGVSDLIVIATGEAVLIVPRGDSQRVKEAVEAIARRGVSS